MPDIFMVKPDQVGLIWDEASKQLARAMDRMPGRYTTDDVLASIMAGETQLWVAMDGEDMLSACVTRIYATPLSRILGIEWIGGDAVDLWANDGLDLFERFARDNNCAKIEGYCRRGWKKILESKDWTELHTKFEKDLSNGRNSTILQLH